MSPDHTELTELRARIAELTTEEQLLLIEGILGRIRRSYFSDPTEYRRELEALVAHETFGSEPSEQGLSVPESVRGAG